MNNIRLMPLDYAVMCLYLLAIIVISVFCSRRNNSSEDYLLGGRKLPFYAVGISFMMAMLSTVSLVATPGEIFNHGMTYFVLSPILPLLSIGVFCLIGRFYFKMKVFTPFEYLEVRYDRSVRSLIAAICGFGRVIYLALVLFSTGKVFEGGAGWPCWFTILLIGVIGTAYTLFGGTKGVVWTDVMQFVILMGGILLALSFIVIRIDLPLGETVTYAFRNGHGFSEFNSSEFFQLNPYVRLSFWLILAGGVLSVFGENASDQTGLQRLFSTSSFKEAIKAKITSAALQVVMVTLLAAIGAGIFTYYSLNPDKQVLSGDTAFFTFVSTELPVPLPGLFMAAMAAAALSTIAAVINSLATVYLKEFHQLYINPQGSERHQVTVAKAATAGAGAFGVVMALMMTVSSSLLGQSFVEVGVLFSILDGIVFPAFFYAFLSNRISTTKIYIAAGIFWGMRISMMAWYSLSTYDTLNWESGMGLAYGGVVSWQLVLWPLLLGILLLALWKRIDLKHVFLRHITMAVALMPGGFALGGSVWCLLSRWLVTDTPRALSFTWMDLPILGMYVLFGAFLLTLGKPQPPEKCQGLTVWDAGKALRIEPK